MSSRASFHLQLASIMETAARSALAQVCKLVDEDSAEVRLELSRLLLANSALAEEVSRLESELTAERGDAPGPVSGPPTIEGIYGKDWCVNLWKDRDPYRLERVTHSPLSPEKEGGGFPESVATLSELITVTEVKEEDYVLGAASICQQETLITEENEESLVGEPEQPSVGYSAAGSTCSLSFDQDGEQDVFAGGIEEPSMELISMNDTEDAFSAHIIPIEDDDDDDHDDDVQFVEESQQELMLTAAGGPSRYKQQKLPANNSENTESTALDTDSHNDSNVLNVETVSDPNRGKFSCRICSRAFFHKGTLTHHMKSHKSNFCNICKQHFPHRSKLNCHTCVPPVPSQRVTKSCELCGKTFANPSALRIHYVVHTGEKPYRCSLCGKGFTQKGNLKCHLRIHTGERPFCCVKCGKTFTQKVNLNHHLMAHRNREVMGEKPITLRQTRLKKQ